jgi:hypothetical protein
VEKEETTYGLSPKHLARLLAIGLEKNDGENKLGDTRTPAQELQEILTSKLSLDPATPDSIPAILNRPCGELLPAAGRTIGDVLLDRATHLGIIRTLKDYGKQLVRRSDTKSRQAAATVIYYAAIASALLFHRQKISRHSYENLNEAYAQLHEKPWIGPKLKDLFKKAQEICEKRKTKKPNNC